MPNTLVNMSGIGPGDDFGQALDRSDTDCWRDWVVSAEWTLANLLSSPGQAVQVTTEEVE